MDSKLKTMSLFFGCKEIGNLPELKKQNFLLHFVCIENIIMSVKVL